MGARLAVLGLLLLGACASPYTPAEKWSSFREHRELRLAGLPADEFLRARSALLVRSALVRSAVVRSSTLDVGVDAAPGSAISLGMAVPLTPDGYYLTAAHCVSGEPVVRTDDGRYVVAKERREPVLSVVVTDGRHARHARAALVWISERADLALVRSAAAPFAVFEGRAARVPEGALVVAGGYASLVGPSELAEPQTYTGPSAGTARGYGSSTADGRELRHDAPLAGGDSGGPLVTREGALVGVNTRIMGGLFGRGDSIALQPEWALLDALIAADRRER